MPDEKEPWFKFWVDAWRGDSALRSCSWAAKGVWIEMICIMHEEGVPYGHLAAKQGFPMPEPKLATKLGMNPTELRRILSELQENDIFSRTDTGVIFSRRMVRDAQRKLARKQTAKLGGQALWQSIRQAQQQSKEQATVSSVICPLSSETGSEEKNAGANANEPVIPTVQEVREFGNGAAGIPADYCEYYHGTCTEKQRWVTGAGRALLWKLEIVRWWAGARPSWRGKTLVSEKSGDAEQIKAELQYQKDPVKCSELFQKLRELEGK